MLLLEKSWATNFLDSKSCAHGTNNGVLQLAFTLADCTSFGSGESSPNVRRFPEYMLDKKARGVQEAEGGKP